MTLREEIVARIQRLPDNRLPELNHIIEQLENKEEKPGFLKRLQKIKIEAPSDFSENFDLYANGEKEIETDIR